MAQKPKFSGVLFGAAYYPEYQATDTVDRDLDLMKAAGVTVIRVGESVWSTWEPRPGEFELEWLAPVLDGAQDRGIKVILGTPTYAIPPWLQKAHPEIAIQRESGERMGWGSRQEMDQSHPAYRWYAERVIRQVVNRYAGHPAVVGFQVDNEPGLYLVHNESTFLSFVGWLRNRYGTVDALNDAWGLTYWSHRLSDWSELWRPSGNSLPEYQLEWRRFQATLTTDLVSWQAAIVREYSRPDQFVTTCISYSRPQVSDDELVETLDVVAGNTYYRMQDGLDGSRRDISAEKWWSVGVPALYQWGDRAWSSAQSAYLVTETNAQSIGGPWQNHPPYPGQLKQAAFALVSRGARMIEYWHWHTQRQGPESYWGGVIPHSQVPGRIYREVAQLGADLQSLGAALDSFEPHSDVLMLHSSDTNWAYQSYPPLASTDGTEDSGSYGVIFDAYYRGLFEAGAQVRVMHVRQILERAPGELAETFPVLVIPTLYVADDEVLDLAVAYAEAGGHLVVGIRSGYGDGLGRPRLAVAPDIIGTAAGVSYDEYSNIDSPWPIHEGEACPQWLEQGSAGIAWVDILNSDVADIIAHYARNELGADAAITSRIVGKGRVTYVGTVPNGPLSRSLGRWLVPGTAHRRWEAPPEVTVSTGVAEGREITFVSNWSAEERVVMPPAVVTDLLSGENFAAGQRLILAPREVRVLA